MPPIRTPKTTPSKAGGLAAFGFVPVAKEEALTRAANHTPTAPVVPVKVVLRTVILPGTSDLTDAAVLALCEHCPDLATLDVTDAVVGSNKIGIGAFEAMRQNGDWAPGLKKMAICGVTTTKFMAKMREMLRSRPQLVIDLVSVSQEKKWGDWELERRVNNSYQNGRKMNPYARMGRGGGGGGGGWRGGGGGGGWRGGWRGRGRGGWRQAFSRPY